MMIDIDLLIACGGNFKKIAKGSTIFREGNTCNFYYQLVTGRVLWLNITDEGKEFIQTVIDPGECFGELPLFDSEPYAASAIADEDSVVIRIHKPVFEQLIKENHDIHFKFTRLLVQRIRFKIIILKSLASHHPPLMINALLNYLKKENLNFCADRTQLNLTRQQIADMTGLRVETVIRSMRQMHDDGLLFIEKGKVYC